LKKIKIIAMCCFIFITIAVNGKGEELVMSDDPYTDMEKQYLINLARATLYCYLNDKSIPLVNSSLLPQKLKEKRGCFVTLNKKGKGLRGCIGYILPVENLYEGVINRAVAAAVQDPRFPPVTYDELKDIKIEISILTVPKELKFNSADELLAQLKPLRDGVVLKTPYGSSTYLPQVWQQLPDKEMFLSSLCAKHGAPYNAWRNVADISVSIYQAIVFHEQEYGRKVVGNKGAVAAKQGATILGSAVWEKQDIEKKTVPAGTPIDPLTVLSPDSHIVAQ